MRLHCGSKVHGDVLEGILEIRCTSMYCGAGKGYVVLHRFDLATGELLETARYKDPARRRQQ